MNKQQELPPTLTPDERHALALAPLPRFQVIVNAHGASRGPSHQNTRTLEEQMWLDKAVEKK